MRRPSGEFKVFAGGAWLDAGEALKKVGDPRGRALLVFPLANRQKVLVVDREPWNAPGTSLRKTTFIMSVADKTILAEPALDAANPRFNGEFTYSAAGDPWMEVSRDPQKPFPKSACRMTDRGPVDVVDDAEVLTGDGAGNVWLAFRPPTAKREEIRLYRDGVFIPPAADVMGQYRHLWSTPGGRLCYTSVLGLHMLRFTQRADALTWDAPEILRFGGIESVPNIHGISPLGFVVVSPPRSAGQGMPNLFFYRVARR